jgi:ABC-type uncharacterized transport system substrate-binding protein
LRPLIGGFGGVGCGGWGGPTLAHPHACFVTRSDVVFDDEGRIAAINVEWVLDPWYSEMAVEGLDTNNDGYYSAGELRPLARENIIALKDYNYFVYARSDGQPVDYAEVSQYGMIYTNGTLMMHFTVPLAEPLDPFATQFVYRIYDPSFFIAIDFAEDKPLAALGTPPEPCTIELRAPPTGAEIEATREMLAEKAAEWQPMEEVDFGAMFAQPVAVVCKTKTGA